MDRYGVAETLLIERGGITYGIFGLMAWTPTTAPPPPALTLEDAAQAAERCVRSLEEQGAEFILCLSHSGTSEQADLSEDELLAEAVDGIDVIVSGHTHTTLAEPLVVNGNLYRLRRPLLRASGVPDPAAGERRGADLVDYHLVPIDETLPEDPEIAALVETWKSMVGDTYLDRYGLTYDQVLAAADLDLTLPESGVQQGNGLGELAADAYLWAVEHLEADAPEVPTVSVTAAGVLRAPLYAGEITASEAFDVLSMGVGSDGTSGFPLVGGLPDGKGAAGRRGGGRLRDPSHARCPAVLRRHGIRLQRPPDVLRPGDGGVPLRAAV